MVGRRPVAMFDEQSPSMTFAALLAQTAQLEAAAVVASAELAASLRAFGAPASLVARAEQAQQGEIRHAEIMRGHAVAHGVELSSVFVSCSPRVYANEFALALLNVAHAQWLHDLDAWLATRLNATERVAVAAIKAVACTALLATVGGPTSAAQRRFGLPEQQVAAQLARGLHQQMIAMSGTAPSMS